ncbi:MAG: pseudouridine synthase [Micavibrio sp.]|nr:MAG: pseudouridine synthase [Micavibrio sp.]
MSDVRHIEVSEDDDGQRLDRWLKKHVPEIPYVLAQKLMRKGAIRVNDKKAKPDTRLEAGQEIRIPSVEEGTGHKEKARKDKPKDGPKLSSQDIEYIKSLVIYEDADVIALNKPPGLATQGGTNIKRHVDGLLDGLTNKKGVRPRLVHRLDKDTSGVLLLARSSQAAKELGRIFKSREIKKIYFALTAGVPEVREGEIKAPLAKAGGAGKEKMCIDEKEGKMAITEYRVLEHALNRAAFVAFWPRTGRTHQIRAHAALVLECPILGDGKYGGQDAIVEGLKTEKRVHLHAARIVCPHPLRKGKLDIAAPLPPELKKSWKSLGFEGSHKEDPFPDIPA